MILDGNIFFCLSVKLLKQFVGDNSLTTESNCLIKMKPFSLRSFTAYQCLRLKVISKRFALNLPYSIFL